MQRYAGLKTSSMATRRSSDGIRSQAHESIYFVRPCINKKRAPPSRRGLLPLIDTLVENYYKSKIVGLNCRFNPRTHGGVRLSISKNRIRHAMVDAPLDDGVGCRVDLKDTSRGHLKGSTGNGNPITTLR